jgi:integrase
VSNSGTSRALQARTHVLKDRRGRGARATVFTRLFLVDRDSGDVLEMQTVFVDQEHGNASVHTQIAVLADLAFLYEWCLLRIARDPTWGFPELRPQAGQASLSGQEVADFAAWAALDARELSRALAREASSKVVRSLSAGKPIDDGQFNRRLRTASRYAQWLVRGTASSGQALTTEQMMTVEIECGRIEKVFNSKLRATSKYSPPKSLKRAAAAQLRTQIARKADAACAERDRLMTALLLEGLRAGEVLKLRTFDLDEFYEVQDGQTISIVCILRQPNSADEPRLIPPSVKTLPGDLAIPKALAHDLANYINGHRSDTLEKIGSAVETPYIFINHQGPNSGQPTSQRNLNRIVAKLKGSGVLPESIAPHILRHTHMDEVYETASANGKSGADIREVLLQRGRWSETSAMPRHYTKRALLKESARLIQVRDEGYATN